MSIAKVRGGGNVDCPHTSKSTDSKPPTSRSTAHGAAPMAQRDAAAHSNKAPYQAAPLAHRDCGEEYGVSGGGKTKPPCTDSSPPNSKKPPM
ncbi:hypothetical protein TI39_contig4283g00006 [Zymoseptoria brevis]|uniref:Uncharacterized protein n=1 Tax=Zymoseptoria brevis TaxID=1047168 RepID=A0A0F4GBQ9_9PEZI|nr:hypothetical protein TI39_contig4283g00006 [Zymoseptoria brevis]